MFSKIQANPGYNPYSVLEVEPTLKGKGAKAQPMKGSTRVKSTVSGRASKARICSQTIARGTYNSRAPEASRVFESLWKKPYKEKTATALENAVFDLLLAVEEGDEESLLESVGKIDQGHPANVSLLLHVSKDLALKLGRGGQAVMLDRCLQHLSKPKRKQRYNPALEKRKYVRQLKAKKREEEEDSLQEEMPWHLTSLTTLGLLAVQTLGSLVYSSQATWSFKDRPEDLSRQFDLWHSRSTQERGDTPLATVVLYPESDHNGAFRSPAIKPGIAELYYKTQPYISRVDSVEAACYGLQEAFKQTGRPADIVVFGGHGNPQALRFGDDWLVANKTPFLTRDVVFSAECIDAIASDALIIMRSCSTGRDSSAWYEFSPKHGWDSLAKTLAEKLPGRTIVAPTEDTTAGSLSIDFSEHQAQFHGKDKIHVHFNVKANGSKHDVTARFKS